MSRRKRSWTCLGIASALVLGLLAGCSLDSGDEPCVTQPNGTPVTGKNWASVSGGPKNLATNPEIDSSYRSSMVPVRGRTFAVSTANPHATEAACQVLRAGGTAADALVAAQMVLGLTEPQSSGIGGGAFTLYYTAATGTVDAYDGREVAPQGASENYLRWVSETDHREPQPNPRASGRSIGVPGVLRMLELLHSEHGWRPWRELFAPAITLADRGFPISRRLADQIAASASDLARDQAAREYFLRADGSGKPTGSRLTNPGMSKTLSAIASEGARAFYSGAIAEDIVASVTTTSGDRTPGVMTVADIENYQPKKRTALCTVYRRHEICGMPNPSSGGIAVAAILGILESFDLPALPPTGIDRNGGVPRPEAVHLITEAERLAYADRDKYVADPDFVPLPGGSPSALVNLGYLRQRALLINRLHTMGTAAPGEFGAELGVGPQPREHGTSHISLVDSYGNAATMTTTVESAFGSLHMVGGFLLNNQLTDFSANPVGTEGLPVANRLQPGKRPRSSMSPTLVFDHSTSGERGQLTHVVGSPGGANIIQFVAEALIGMLDWRLNPQQAVSAVSFGATNSAVTSIGGEHPSIDITDNGMHDSLVRRLRQLGHQVSIAPRISGLSVVHLDGAGWAGSADPRREGAVLGDG
ncbi:gamma-glutamyltransferase family protein [Nocardia sp. NPDC050793]|uniref:gamma-glutamyltransferase family protein n=1 Tax=Nocardia sp. NPDC050793 TaxID=3155159 RepID=UPI00340506B9